MNFSQVCQAADELRQLLNTSTGRTMVDQVTIEIPKLPEDELHFVRLVTWAYAFIYEAGQPAFNELKRLVKVSQSPKASECAATQSIVQCLRTNIAHNLPGATGTDEKQRRQAKAWYLEHGKGYPPDWQESNRALCDSLLGWITEYKTAWERAIQDSEDRKNAIASLIAAVENEWPPHLFDRMVEDAATRLGLDGLNATDYRKDRFEGWRKMARCFEKREFAEVAMRRLIHKELQAHFG
ncbi:hypothetical protein [Paraburkholderia tropica]|uniref:Uncharacterized protein n=1 Tax=Paraburkholderia tropica TaxID=92647 RepID=A0AAQ1JYK1_9BURK|nr:hypothetical protein [Paraburkholderia tropica]RQN33690.1 hypothetical protein EHZ25_38475 [Paraburkholderia tropica]SEK15353.1 hypothetical protein SAMN05216550_13725 [Paraburkholderia tropica]